MLNELAGTASVSGDRYSKYSLPASGTFLWLLIALKLLALAAFICINVDYMILIPLALFYANRARTESHNWNRLGMYLLAASTTFMFFPWPDITLWSEVKVSDIQVAVALATIFLILISLISEAIWQKCITRAALIFFAMVSIVLLCINLGRNG